MSYVLKYLPEIEQLTKDLEDINKVKMYRKYGSFIGSPESIEYLHKKLGVDLEPENSYIEERFTG